MLVMSKKIINAIDNNSFESALVVGKRSLGKSSYAIKVAKEVYQSLNDISELDAYQMAIDSICFSLDDIIKVMKTYHYENRKPVVIWDDAGAFGSGLMYHGHISEFAMLKGGMDTIRTVTAGLILTAPNQKSLIRFLQGYDDYIIRIIKESSGWVRVATGYNRTTLPSGKRVIRKLWKDMYSAYLPNAVYHNYMGLRDKYKFELIQQLEKSGKKSANKMKRKLEEEENE
jgi:hypothetical protein